VRIPFVQIDAFATRPFEGNPAAVLPLTHWLDDATLQNIAIENNLSETAFIVPIAGSEDDGGAGADFELRWFTPGAEVALCGHATLASGHHILSSDPSREKVVFKTRQSGLLEVARDGAGYLMALPNWKPHPKPLPEIAAALGLASPVDTLWHESGYALVVVEDEATVRGLRPDSPALARCGPIVAVVAARGQTADIVSRVFTPYYAIDEDPVTGSAHALMVPYWADVLGRDTMSAYQASARGGHLTCRLEGDRVILGGTCVTVIEGTLHI